MAYFVVLLAVLSRFAPHPPNFSPVYGALLFGGAYLKRRDAVWFPVALLAVSDVILTTQTYHMRLGWKDELVGLVAFAAVGLIGYWLQGRLSFRNVVAAALAGPTAFFVISNFGVWWGWRMYPPSAQGLIECYVAALPFFRNTLVSALLFTGVLFGAYEFYVRRVTHSAGSAARVG